MIRIAPSIEAYGTYARRSALADILELQAFQRPSLSTAELSDYIRDSGWVRSLGDQFTQVQTEDGSGDLGEEFDASDLAADGVFSILKERKEILGARYPFEVRSGRLCCDNLASFQRGYALLLAVTVAHSYGLDINGINPRNFFEEVVTSCLSQKGLLAGNLGKARRQTGSLPEAVADISPICKLNPVTDTVLFRRRAQEEGVDVIAHLGWTDSRPFHWVYIVQATCGKSDTWYNKLCEPSEQMWKNILGLKVLPKAVLAVPHHIQRDMTMYLAERGNGERLLLDRLRLCEVDGDSLDRSGEFFQALETIEVDFD
jgi:hypothetical protein